MTMTLKEQAWQSGLVLPDETAQWNETDWPPLEGGWRYRHATVVLDHPHTDNGINNKRQTVVVLGGYQTRQGELESILLLNLADPNKQWREGPPMNKKRDAHAAVTCNCGVYVMGGDSGGSCLNSIERIDANDLLQSASTTSSTHEINWTTLTCRLSMGRFGCCAVAVHDRFIVVMGGYLDFHLSSVDIIDTDNQIVTAGPRMTVPRSYCASAVIGHRIFVVAGENAGGNLHLVEYLDFGKPCAKDKTEKVTASTIMSSTWTTLSGLVLSDLRYDCAAVAVGSCLMVVAKGEGNSTVEVLDTYRNRMWNLPPFGNDREGCTLVAVANQIAVFGGSQNPTCATVPLLDKHTWCFRRLCEQQSNGWYHSLEGIGIRDADIIPFSTLVSARKRARSNTQSGDEGTDEA